MRRLSILSGLFAFCCALPAQADRDYPPVILQMPAPWAGAPSAPAAASAPAESRRAKEAPKAPSAPVSPKAPVAKASKLDHPHNHAQYCDTALCSRYCDKKEDARDEEKYPRLVKECNADCMKECE